MRRSRLKSLNTNQEENISEEHVKIKCILEPYCIEASTDNMKQLTEEILKTCHEKLKIRKKLAIKYSNVTLPENLNETHYYHPKCRNNLVTINKQYMDRYKKLCQQETGIYFFKSL